MELYKKTKEFFKNDIFATSTVGIKIDKITEKETRCSLKIKKDHLNANGFVMGGAIFTLSDFAFAVSANTNLEEFKVVTKSVAFEYILPAKGGILKAISTIREDSSKHCKHKIKVFDDSETLIASGDFLGIKIYNKKV